MDELKHSLSMEISRCLRQECLHTWIIWINLCPWPVVFEFASQEPIRLHTIVSCTFLHDWLCCAKKPVFSKVLDIHTGSSQCIIRDDSFKIIAVHRSSIDTPREEPFGPKTPSTTEDICRCGWRVTQATFRSILADQWLEFHCQIRPTDDQQYFFSWFSPPPSTIHQHPPTNIDIDPDRPWHPPSLGENSRVVEACLPRAVGRCSDAPGWLWTGCWVHQGLAASLRCGYCG